MKERTLLDWLCDRFPDSPRKRVKDWFATGRVHLDGAPVTVFHRKMADPGERLELAGPRTTDRRLEADPRVRVVFADDDLFVIDKAAGLLSVPAPDLPREDSALEVLQKLSSGTVLPVHRLDRYTSGLICFARSERARERLIERLRAGAIDRGYTAFVKGAPAEASGVWRDLLEMDREGRQKPSGEGETETSRWAVTRFTVARVYKGEGGAALAAKLRLELETGLKHQIRIQASLHEVPLLGDRIYDPKKKGPVARHRVSEDQPPVGRQALHASSLSLPHPRTGERLAFECPLPRDLARLERWLGKW